MRLPWILTAFAIAGAAYPALAQPTDYQTPLYSSSPPAVLDKNFGLPTFGMPGSELPQLKTMAPEKEPPPKQDFFAGSTDMPLPKARRSMGSGSATETPLFTTSQGMMNQDPTTQDSTTGETPLFTTGQGFSSGDTGMETGREKDR